MLETKARVKKSPHYSPCDHCFTSLDSNSAEITYLQYGKPITVKSKLTQQNLILLELIKSKL